MHNLGKARFVSQFASHPPAGPPHKRPATLNHSLSFRFVALNEKSCSCTALTEFF